MTTMDRAATPRLIWEPFDPHVIGYEALGEWLREFYSIAPWNEYRKCYACSNATDFTAVGTWGRSQVGTDDSCPDCGGALVPFWTPERAELFFAALGAKGRVMGLTVMSDGKFAGCLWGYEIGPDTPAPWEPRPEGAGVYIDRILVLPEHRNGIALWYLLAMTLREFGRGHDFLMTRTHIKAAMVRTMLQRLNFRELNGCPILPQRSYWARSLEIQGGLPASLH